jgi:hypothetical protein
MGRKSALRTLLERERQRLNLVDNKVVRNADQGNIPNEVWATRIYWLRRERDRIFDDGLFADPAWDLLLNLFIENDKNESISISSACKAVSVPEATALRYLSALTEKNYVERIAHPTDRRSIMLRMTLPGTTLMRKWLDRFDPSR